MSKLPDKLSDLIELALTDLEWVEKQPDKYMVNMLEWHCPYADVCYVCLAGAVMAHTLETPVTEDVSPSDTVEDCKLQALDAVRHGFLRTAYYHLHGSDPGFMYAGECSEELGLDEGEVDIERYTTDPDQFKEDLRFLVDVLRMVGQ